MKQAKNGSFIYFCICFFWGDKETDKLIYFLISLWYLLEKQKSKRLEALSWIIYLLDYEFIEETKWKPVFNKRINGLWAWPLGGTQENIMKLRLVISSSSCPRPCDPIWMASRGRDRQIEPGDLGNLGLDSQVVLSWQLFLTQKQNRSKLLLCETFLHLLMIY